ncbi:MAG: pyridoxamine 5'-phosphate oxidase family protein [Clostridia bacterium]|nr:pyridoxamine 5'-phosphate oxidase family protein [Clostridia bacterium]
MFRKMRRFKQELSREESIGILESNTSGVLGLMGDDEYPYTVPLSYVYDDDKIYFHSGREGHKVSAIKACDKASFCVIDKDEVVPPEYTTYFRSVIAFGRVRFSDDENETMYAIDLLARKYAPEDTAENRKAAIDREYDQLAVAVMEIEHMTGKEAIELVKKRKAR